MMHRSSALLIASSALNRRKKRPTVSHHKWCVDEYRLAMTGWSVVRSGGSYRQISLSTSLAGGHLTHIVALERKSVGWLTSG